MSDDAVAQFTAITSCDAERASQYLRVADNDVEQALQLWFESGGVDLGADLPQETPQISTSSATSNQMDLDDDDNTNVEGGAHQAPGGGHSVEDDEAMARRLQDEMYGSAGGETRQDAIDPETGVRAPMARTAETLADPMPSWQDDPEQMRAAIAEQLLERQRRRQPGKSSRTISLHA